MSRYSLVYITTANKKEALKIARAVLAKKLAAGSNIIDRVSSLYWWKGKVQSAKEALLIFKTTKKAVPRLIRTVKAIHSYECPCIIELPIGQGDPDFLRWLADI
ncbi:MAG: divalent-cation tolerance protein CutA [Candidatus Saganbacteria bacterium]|nr:divalent-cation tolerance protein CutA [Candidatus Saganbacteria bacterium]